MDLTQKMMMAAAGSSSVPIDAESGAKPASWSVDNYLMPTDVGNGTGNTSSLIYSPTLNKYILINPYSLISTSTDGITWSKWKPLSLSVIDPAEGTTTYNYSPTYPAGNTLNQSKCGGIWDSTNNKFIIYVGRYLFSSTDGVTWTGLGQPGGSNLQTTYSEYSEYYVLGISYDSISGFYFITMGQPSYSTTYWAHWKTSDFTTWTRNSSWSYYVPNTYHGNAQASVSTVGSGYIQVNICGYYYFYTRYIAGTTTSLDPANYGSLSYNTRDIKVAAGYWVTCNDGGQIRYATVNHSSTSLSWSTTTPQSSVVVDCLAVKGNDVYAFYRGGKIYKATGGPQNTWNLVYTGTKNHVSAIVNSSGTIIAITEDFAVVYSTDDGTTWTTSSALVGIEDKINTSRKMLSSQNTRSLVAYSPTLNLYIRGQNDNTLLKSADGASWTLTGVTTATTITMVTWVNDRFIIGTTGAPYYSTDGTSFVQLSGQTGCNGMRDVIYAQNKYVAVLNNTNFVSYSTDGLTWTTPSSANTAINPYSNRYTNYTPWLYYIDNKFAANYVDSYGYFRTIESSDGVAWAPSLNYSPRQPYLYRSATFNGYEYQVIAGNLFRHNENTWEKVITADLTTTNLTSNPSSNTVWVLDVASSSSKIIVLTNKSVYTSTDGVTWTHDTSTFAAYGAFATSLTLTEYESYSAQTKARIACDKDSNTFIISFGYASNKLTSKDNGVTWELSPAGRVHKCVYSSGLNAWVALFDQSDRWMIAYSTDGIAWTLLRNYFGTAASNSLYARDITADSSAVYAIEGTSEGGWANANIRKWTSLSYNSTGTTYATTLWIYPYIATTGAYKVNIVSNGTNILAYYYDGSYYRLKYSSVTSLTSWTDCNFSFKGSSYYSNSYYLANSEMYASSDEDITWNGSYFYHPRGWRSATGAQDWEPCAAGRYVQDITKDPSTNYYYILTRSRRSARYVIFKSTRSDGALGQGESWNFHRITDWIGPNGFSDDTSVRSDKLIVNGDYIYLLSRQSNSYSGTVYYINHSTASQAMQTESYSGMYDLAQSTSGYVLAAGVNGEIRKSSGGPLSVASTAGVTTAIYSVAYMYGDMFLLSGQADANGAWWACKYSATGQGTTMLYTKADTGVFASMSSMFKLGDNNYNNNYWIEDYAITGDGKLYRSGQDGGNYFSNYGNYYSLNSDSLNYVMKHINTNDTNVKNYLWNYEAYNSTRQTPLVNFVSAGIMNTPKVIDTFYNNYNASSWISSGGSPSFAQAVAVGGESGKLWWCCKTNSNTNGWGSSAQGYNSSYNLLGGSYGFIPGCSDIADIKIAYDMSSSSFTLQVTDILGVSFSKTLSWNGSNAWNMSDNAYQTPFAYGAGSVGYVTNYNPYTSTLYGIDAGNYLVKTSSKKIRDLTPAKVFVPTPTSGGGGTTGGGTTSSFTFAEYLNGTELNNYNFDSNYVMFGFNDSTFAQAFYTKIVAAVDANPDETIKVIFPSTNFGTSFTTNLTISASNQISYPFFGQGSLVGMPRSAVTFSVNPFVDPNSTTYQSLSTGSGWLGWDFKVQLGTEPAKTPIVPTAMIKSGSYLNITYSTTALRDKVYQMIYEAAGYNSGVYLQFSRPVHDGQSYGDMVGRFYKSQNDVLYNGYISKSGSYQLQIYDPYGNISVYNNYQWWASIDSFNRHTYPEGGTFLSIENPNWISQYSYPDYTNGKVNLYGNGSSYATSLFTWLSTYGYYTFQYDWNTNYTVFDSNKYGAARTIEQSGTTVSITTSSGGYSSQAYQSYRGFRVAMSSANPPPPPLKVSHYSVSTANGTPVLGATSGNTEFNLTTNLTTANIITVLSAYNWQYGGTLVINALNTNTSTFDKVTIEVDSFSLNPYNTFLTLYAKSYTISSGQGVGTSGSLNSITWTDGDSTAAWGTKTRARAHMFVTSQYSMPYGTNSGTFPTIGSNGTYATATFDFDQIDQWATNSINVHKGAFEKMGWTDGDHIFWSMYTGYYDSAGRMFSAFYHHHAWVGNVLTIYCYTSPGIYINYSGSATLDRIGYFAKNDGLLFLDRSSNYSVYSGFTPYYNDLAAQTAYNYLSAISNTSLGSTAQSRVLIQDQGQYVLKTLYGVSGSSSNITWNTMNNASSNFNFANSSQVVIPLHQKTSPPTVPVQVTYYYTQLSSYIATLSGGVTSVRAVQMVTSPTTAYSNGPYYDMPMGSTTGYFDLELRFYDANGNEVSPTTAGTNTSWLTTWWNSAKSPASPATYGYTAFDSFGMPNFWSKEGFSISSITTLTANGNGSRFRFNYTSAYPNAPWQSGGMTSDITSLIYVAYDPTGGQPGTWTPVKIDSSATPAVFRTATSSINNGGSSAKLIAVGNNGVIAVTADTTGATGWTIYTSSTTGITENLLNAYWDQNNNKLLVWSATKIYHINTTTFASSGIVYTPAANTTLTPYSLGFLTYPTTSSFTNSGKAAYQYYAVCEYGSKLTYFKTSETTTSQTQFGSIAWNAYTIDTWASGYSPTLKGYSPNILMIGRKSTGEWFYIQSTDQEVNTYYFLMNSDISSSDSPDNYIPSLAVEDNSGNSKFIWKKDNNGSYQYIYYATLYPVYGSINDSYSAKNSLSWSTVYPSYNYDLPYSDSYVYSLASLRTIVKPYGRESYIAGEFGVSDIMTNSPSKPYVFNGNASYGMSYMSPYPRIAGKESSTGYHWRPYYNMGAVRVKDDYSASYYIGFGSSNSDTQISAYFGQDGSGSWDSGSTNKYFLQKYEVVSRSDLTNPNAYSSVINLSAGGSNASQQWNTANTNGLYRNIFNVPGPTGKSLVVSSGHSSNYGNKRLLVNTSALSNSTSYNTYNMNRHMYHYAAIEKVGNFYVYFPDQNLGGNSAYIETSDGSTTSDLGKNIYSTTTYGIYGQGQVAKGSNWISWYNGYNGYVSTATISSRTNFNIVSNIGSVTSAPYYDSNTGRVWYMTSSGLSVYTGVNSTTYPGQAGTSVISSSTNSAWSTFKTNNGIASNFSIGYISNINNKITLSGRDGALATLAPNADITNSSNFNYVTGLSVGSAADNFGVGYIDYNRANPALSGYLMSDSRNMYHGNSLYSFKALNNKLANSSTIALNHDAANPYNRIVWSPVHNAFLFTFRNTMYTYNPITKITYPKNMFGNFFTLYKYFLTTPTSTRLYVNTGGNSVTVSYKSSS